MNTEETFIKLNNISKCFPGVKALDGINLTLKRGEVHCLAGQNGCGKSTLIKIISGVYQPEPGAEITIAGERVSRLNPAESVQRGVQVIYQDLSLFPNLTVAENIAVNRHQGAGLVSWKAIRQSAQAVMERLGVQLDLDEKVENLSIADRQIVAICRAIAAKAELVIMDEPTASLTRQEVKGLLKVVADLKAKGICVVFISHRLEEVMDVSDRVTVIRDGVMVGTYNLRDGSCQMDDKELAFLMTGQRFEFNTLPAYAGSNETVLEVCNLRNEGQYKNISFSVRAGEILGITGLLGSGRTEMCLSLFGMNPPDNGEVLVDGKSLQLNSNRDAINAGIAYVSEDRMGTGLVMDQPIRDNIIATVLKKMLGRTPDAKVGQLLDEKRCQSLVDELVKELNIKVADTGAAVKTLSGGNAQRISIAKWVAAQPRVLILDSPTVGVDIANKEGIYRIARKLADQGLAIVMVSDEIPEAFYNAHRVLVMSKGEIVDQMLPSEGSEEQLAAIVSGKQFSNTASAASAVQGGL